MPPRATRRSSPAWNLALATIAFAVCFSAWGLIAPLAKEFEDDLDLSTTETLLLTAIPVVLGSLLRIPMGVLTDRHGGRRVFALLLAFAAVPAVLFGYAESYWALLGVGFLLGVAGSSFAVGVPFVAGWYRAERQGFALGVYGTGNIGTAVAAFSAPAIVTAFGRSALGWAAAAVLLVTAGGFALGARDAPRDAPPTRYRDVLRSGVRLWRLAFFYFVTFGGFVAMALLLPTLLADWFDYSLVEAGLRAAGFTVVATLARPVGGWLADRAGAYPVLVLSFAGVAVDAAVLAALAPEPRIVPITVACLSLAALLGAGSGAVFKLVPAEFPRDAGAAAGLVGAAGGLGGFFPPIFMGVVKDATGTYTVGFLGLLIATAACILVAVWLLRSAPVAELRGARRADVQETSPAGGAGELSLPDSGDPLFAIDRGLRIVAWNRAAERLTGVQDWEALGRCCWAVIDGVDRDGEGVCHPGCAYAQAVWDGRPIESPELLVATTGGRRRTALSTFGIGGPEQPLLVHTLHELEDR